MPVSRALRRLLRIRSLQEDRSRLEFESALAELHRLEQALQSAVNRERAGRRWIAASAGSGEIAERLSGIEQSQTAAVQAKTLSGSIERAEDDASALRDVYLARRVERRQADTLIDEARAFEAIESARRGQQMQDDWFAIRRHGKETLSGKASRSAPGTPRVPPQT